MALVSGVSAACSALAGCGRMKISVTTGAGMGASAATTGSGVGADGGVGCAMRHRPISGVFYVVRKPAGSNLYGKGFSSPHGEGRLLSLSSLFLTTKASSIRLAKLLSLRIAAR